MTNRDMIKSILDDTNKLVEFLVESPCKHCGYCGIDECCNIDDEYLDKDLADACMAGIKKWLESEAEENGENEIL